MASPTLTSDLLLRRPSTTSSPASRIPPEVITLILKPSAAILPVPGLECRPKGHTFLSVCEGPLAGYFGSGLHGLSRSRSRWRNLEDPDQARDERRRWGITRRSRVGLGYDQHVLSLACSRFAEGDGGVGKLGDQAQLVVGAEIAGLEDCEMLFIPVSGRGIWPIQGVRSITLFVDV